MYIFLGLDFFSFAVVDCRGNVLEIDDDDCATVKSTRLLDDDDDAAVVIVVVFVVVALVNVTRVILSVISWTNLSNAFLGAFKNNHFFRNIRI